MDRVILHSDINNCFAGIELLSRPELRDSPVAVCGSERERHGIVLAKNEAAKVYGVKTAMTVWQARQLCPQLTILEPHYDLYLQYSRIIREIYGEYTDRCEPFGIDESWLDLTSCYAHPDGYAAAEELRKRIKNETGLTVSIGVSWNKTLAKLASDYKKPDAVTQITRENFRELVWPMSAGELLTVGRKTAARLAHLGIYTIGDIARTDPVILKSALGKNGISLHAAANGLDAAPVMRCDELPPAKSIGNSTTAAEDITGEYAARLVLMQLADEVGFRLRREGFRCRTVELSVRNAQTLGRRSHRLRLRAPTDISRELYEIAVSLWRETAAPGEALRSLGIRATELEFSADPEQLDIFSNQIRRTRRRKIDRTMDSIREKYGRESIQTARQALNLCDSPLVSTGLHNLPPPGARSFM